MLIFWRTLINKAAYLTGTALLAQGNYFFMAGVSAACIALPLANTIFGSAQPEAYNRAMNAVLVMLMHFRLDVYHRRRDFICREESVNEYSSIHGWFGNGGCFDLHVAHSGACTTCRLHQRLLVNAFISGLYGFW